MRDYRHILVTGGAGFAGSHIALRLKAQLSNAEVTVLDNLHRKGSELNIPRLEKAGIRFVRGDIRDRDALNAIAPVDLLIEASAEPSVLAGYGDSPEYVVDTNLCGALNCMERARVNRSDFVFLSTSRVYPVEPLCRMNLIETETRFELADEQPFPGVSPAGIAEDFPLEGVRSIYGATKLAAEMMFIEYLDAYDMRGFIDRCGVLCGPWQMGKIDQGIVAFWAARHVFGQPLQYIGFGGTGKQVRDLLHIDDLCDLLMIQLDRMDDMNGQTFNVGGGRMCSVSLRELTDLCREATGRDVPVTSSGENRKADIPLYLSDTARITAACGWAPTRAPVDCVRDTTKWIEEHRDVLRDVFGIAAPKRGGSA